MIFETHVDFVFQGVFQLQGGAQQVYITPDTEQPDSWSVLQTTSGETFKQTFFKSWEPEATWESWKTFKLDLFNLYKETKNMDLGNGMWSS